MNQAFQNSAQVLSIGIFFTPMIVGLAATLPQTPEAGLQAHGVPPATAHEVAGLPPISILFATFLGENPIVSVVDPSVLAGLNPHDQAALTGNSFFPGDLGAVPRWPARRLHLRDRGLPHRRSHLLDAGARRLRRPRAAISPRVPAVAPERSAG